MNQVDDPSSGRPEQTSSTSTIRAVNNLSGGLVQIARGFLINSHSFQINIT